ncbi:uncharacterized protein V1516DRAFT_676686 [Lipomyces oligophaga]|uniref:uncharacterized protein n=1 Tax=Lipomyces oligophaga TaxID=45792 RepID=UPI0034CDB4EC
MKILDEPGQTLSRNLIPTLTRPTLLRCPKRTVSLATFGSTTRTNIRQMASSNAKAFLRSVDSGGKRERVDSPLADYEKGRLRCVACGITLTRDDQWLPHVGTTTHKSSVEKYNERQKRREKRLLESSLETEVVSARGRSKRTKGLTDNGEMTGDIQLIRTNATEPEVDKEWEAFQNDIAALNEAKSSNGSRPEVLTNATLAFTAGSDIFRANVISQAPTLYETQSVPTTEEKANDEVEDFTNELQDQFDEQKGLEDRVRMLKELRKKRAEQNEDETETHPAADSSNIGPQDSGGKEEEEGAEDTDDPDIDEFGFWRPRR